MHTITPLQTWKIFYNDEEDNKSLFYKNGYEEGNAVYNYCIHPDWNSFDSSTLYLKILFIDYKKHFAIIEFIGEWNDVIENDIMKLKRNIIDELLKHKIFKFVLIAEYVFNFFRGDDDYYLEWQDDVAENKGWISIVNMPPQSLDEFNRICEVANLRLYEIDNWRTLTPEILWKKLARTKS